MLPDSRTQIVRYTADDVNGYNAEVQYEGQARASAGYQGGGYQGGGYQGGGYQAAAGGYQGRNIFNTAARMQYTRAKLYRMKLH